MENKDLRFAVGIKQPTKEILDVLSDVDLYDIDNGKTFVFKENDIDVYDELADHVADEDAVNTNVVFGIFNTKDYNFFERPEIEKVVRESEDLSTEDMLTLEVIPDLDPSDKELKKAIDESIKDINFQFYGGVEKSESHSPETSTNDKEGNVEDKTQTEEKIEEKKPENNSTTLKETSSEPVQESAQDNVEESVPAEEQNNNMINENQAQEAYDEASIDPLLKYSAKRFKDESKAELPMYDEVTTKQILPAFLNSETVMSNEQDNAIYRIYDKLQAARPQIEREFDEKFAENQEEHEKTVQTLKENKETELEELVVKQKTAYENDKQSYINSQKSVLEAQFDKEHKADYDFNLEHEKEMVRQKYERKIEEENARYEEFRAEEEEKYLEAQLGKVDIDDILQDFEDENKRQISIIMNEAKKFSDQVAVATEKISADRDEWKQKAAEAENKAKTLDETYEKRVAVDVKNEVAERTRDLKGELASAKEQLNDSAEKMQDLGKKHADELSQQATQHEAELHKMRHTAELDKQQALKKQQDESDAKYQKLQADYDNFKKQSEAEKALLEKENKNIKDENAMQHSLISTLQERESEQKAAVENQSEQVIRNVKPVQEQQFTMPPRQETPKTSKGTKWLIGGLTVLALGGAGFSIYEMGSHNATNSQPQTSVSATVQNQGQSAPYAKGDKVSYTDKDGNKHEVTITSVSGNKSIGYYTDDGNRYQVTFNN